MIKPVLPFEYKRRQPETTVLYHVVQNHYQNFFFKKSSIGIEYPKFVINTFKKYLTCGILENGFVRCYCKTCRAEILVSFSCKARGFCSSCHGRRQAESAVHLDGIFPNYQYRQWVLSLPYEIRYIVANNAKLTSKILNVFTKSVERWYRKKARDMGYGETVAGSVLFIHRFNSALTLSPHFHSLFLDGVYYKKNDQYFFLSIGSPKKTDLEKIVERICIRVKKILLKLEPTENMAIDSQNPTQNGVGHIQVLEHFMPVPKTEYKEDEDPYSAKLNGFSLNAKVVVQKDRRDKLKKLIGYVARGPIAQDRIKEITNGVCYKLKKTWCNGATHVIFTYESFIQRLVALVPPAKSNQTRFFGIFAPNFKDRDKIITTKNKDDCSSIQKSSRKVLWADLIKMTYGIDITICKACNGRMAPIAVIKDKKVARLILDALKLTAKFEGIKTGMDPPDGQNHKPFIELSDQRPTDW